MFCCSESKTGTKASPSEQLSMTLAWDRADIAQKDVLVYGQHWQVRMSKTKGIINAKL